MRDKSETRRKLKSFAGDMKRKKNYIRCFGSMRQTFLILKTFVVPEIISSMEQCLYTDTALM